MLANWIKRGAILTAAVGLVVLGFVLGTAVISSTAATKSAPPVLQIGVTEPLTEREQHLADLYTNVSPSVVAINVAARRGGSRFFDDDDPITGSGSGFVIDQQGYIVTNNHVVDGATRIEVNFFDGTIVPGEIVGLDPDSDLAVLQVDVPPEKLRPIEIGDSDALLIGQSAVAIGSPFSQRWTMTTGIVSALDRTISGLTQFSIGSVIQTDAAINPGNSGGPLMNLQGQLIGVNSQILSGTRSNSGVGFAIPSNLVSRVAVDLIENGEVNYSFLGIESVRDGVDLDLIETLNLPNNLRGVVIRNVQAGGPADQGGVRSEDVITQVNGVDTPGMSSLVSFLASHTRPGDVVNMTVWRDGDTLTLPVTVGERP